MSQTLDIPVGFGGVSIGESTARLSMKIEREVISINAADEAFCGRRLKGRIQLGGNGDSPDQTKMFDTDLHIDATFDIHRFGVSVDSYSTGATFKLKEIEIGDLARFSKGSGRLIVDSIEFIPEEAKEEKPSTPGELAQDGPWREVSLGDLFNGAILKSLYAANLTTVGELHDYQQPGKNGFIKRLIDIPGIGEGKSQQIEDRMLQFWADNPQEED